MRAGVLPAALLSLFPLANEKYLQKLSKTTAILQTLIKYAVTLNLNDLCSSRSSPSTRGRKMAQILNEIGLNPRLLSLSANSPQMSLSRLPSCSGTVTGGHRRMPSTDKSQTKGSIFAELCGQSDS